MSAKIRNDMTCPYSLEFVRGWVAAWPQQPIRTLRVIVLAMLALLATPGAGEAQSRKTPRLCFLTFDPGTFSTRSARFDGFFNGLQDLGYVQGRNIDITYLSADNNGDRFPTLIDECLSLKPDVIAVTTTPAAHLLKKATRTIPIVMVALGDPLGTGLVDSLSRPSENITGMSLMVPQLAVKRLELLRELTGTGTVVSRGSHCADTGESDGGSSPLVGRDVASPRHSDGR